MTFIQLVVVVHPGTDDPVRNDLLLLLTSRAMIDEALHCPTSHDRSDLLTRDSWTQRYSADTIPEFPDFMEP